MSYWGNLRYPVPHVFVSKFTGAQLDIGVIKICAGDTVCHRALNYWKDRFGWVRLGFEEKTAEVKPVTSNMQAVTRGTWHI